MAKRASSTDQRPEVASFEKSLEELQLIVSELEDGQIGLEASLARFERGIGLLRSCYSILETAEVKIEILTRLQGTEATTTEFEVTSTFSKSEAEFDPSGQAPELPPARGESSGSSLF
jgi:exodeoxyribonuclease VII small subunit